MIRAWKFRDKLLALTLLPVVGAFALLAFLFTFRLETVWRDVVSMQADLLRLDSLCREFQSEVREFALLGEEETRDEISANADQFSAVLARLESGNAMAAQIAEDLKPQILQLLTWGRRIVETIAESTSASGTPGIESENSVSLGGGLGGPPLGERLGDELEEFENLERSLENQIHVERDRAAAEVGAAFQRFRFWILVCAGLGIVLAFLMAIFIIRTLSRPLRALQKASERILDGDYRARDHVHSGGELGQLAEGFDVAAAEIRRLVREKEKSLEALKLNQAQLIQSAKMAAVGELAAGVAHEINNPLSAVLTYSVLLREKANSASPESIAGVPKLAERLDLIEAAGLRCRSISQKLLSFSRQDDEEKGPVDLPQVVEASIELVAATLRRARVVVDRDFELGSPPIRGSANQLQQIFINLINNAVHAMPDGGRLGIRVRGPGFPVASVRGGGNGDREETGYCHVEVSDDGHGIDPAIRERLFEPFVTTKPVGEGTGLGLSIVYSLVMSHDGEIEVESEPGEGTTFKLRFPPSRDGG